MQEVGADGTVAILETGQDDAILHLRHLGADFDRQRIGGRTAPRRVPGAAHALPHGSGLIDVRCATGRDDHGFCAEHVEVAGAHVEADGARHAVFVALVREKVRNHDAVVDLGGGLARGLGYDRLVALAVDHDLPFAFTLITPRFRVAHDRQAPFLELVHRRVHVPRDVVAQVLTHEAHQVIAGVTYVVLWLVLVPLHAHVAVDRIQALGNRAAALDICFFDAHDLEVAAPVPGLVGGAATGHPAADDENVGIYVYRFSS